MTESPIDLVSAAFVAAQAELRPAQFDSTNPFLKNRYASLGAIIEASQPILARACTPTKMLTGMAKERTETRLRRILSPRNVRRHPPHHKMRLKPKLPRQRTVCGRLMCSTLHRDNLTAE